MRAASTCWAISHNSNISKDRKKLVLMKLWRSDPANQKFLWRPLVPETEGDNEGDNSEDNGNEESREGGSGSGHSTPIIQGQMGPTGQQTGQQTGQTGQTSRSQHEPSPDASPRQSSPAKLENLGLEELDDEEEVVVEDPIAEYHGGCPGDPQTKHDIYEFIENPETPAAHAFSGFVMFVIVFSVGTMIAESIPKYMYNSDGSDNTDAKATFFILETICIVIFTIEFGARLYCVPDKCSMMQQPMNIIDVLAIAPYYLTLFLELFGLDMSKIKILRLLRLIRVFRVLKLAKYNRSLAVAIQALRDSTDMFGLMIFMLLVLCILFASFEYNFEMDSTGSPISFSSIPQAMWWCHVTVMMVGYGDMYPETVPGKIIASGCIVIGILIMALPISVIGSNFSRTWAQYEARQREEQKLLETQTKLSPEQELAKELEALEAVANLNRHSCDLLQQFSTCCKKQVHRIEATERDVFDRALDVWREYAVDAKRLTPAVELYRERQVRAKVCEEEALMKSLAEDNAVLSKVLDAELDEQLCRALVNAQWTRVVLRKFALLHDDVEAMSAHLGRPHRMAFPDVAAALQNATLDQVAREQAEQPTRHASTHGEGGAGERATPQTPQQDTVTPRARTPSPPTVETEARD